MIEGFKHLTTEEFGTLRDTLPMIAALIGGADGDFDTKERNWAKKIANIYTFSKEDPLDGFFTKAADHFSEKAGAIYSQHPDLEERNAFISEELAKLNDIFPKLETRLASKLYDSFLHFGKEVARSSGGIFGFLSVSPNETRLAKLPMVNPVN